nr:hypothetical protein [Tanacetum cinerariifolium]
IDEDDMEEMDIKWNMALLSMRADRFGKKTGKKISIQGTDMAGFDKLKVECFNCHQMGHFARECRAPKSQDRGRRDNYKQGSKVEEQAPKALMAIDKVGWDWSYMANDEENHALVASKEASIEFALMAKTSAESKSPPKKDMSWTGHPEFKDDTVTDYSRPVPTVESSPYDAQNRNSFVTETEASPTTISPKSFIKFIKANDSPTNSKTDKAETAKKPLVKFYEGFQDQQAESFTAFPFIPISVVGPFVLPAGNFLLAMENFLLAVGKFLLPVENFLLTGVMGDATFSEREGFLFLSSSEEPSTVLHHSSANSWQWDLYSSGSGNTLHWQWELILPVGTYTASGNSLLAVGMPCAFYSQHTLAVET